MLFAQAAGGPGGVNPNLWAIIVGVCSCYLLVLIGFLLLEFFFCRTIARVLRLCHPDVQRMRPGLAYLNMIPCVQNVWCFITVIQLANTLQAEYDDRRLGDERETDYGRTLGLAGCILYLVGNFIPVIPGLIDPKLQPIGSGIAGMSWLALLVLFVLYWVRIAGYGRELADDDEDREYADDDESDDDMPEPDRPPPLPETPADDPPH